jgi:hypothetical protein
LLRADDFQIPTHRKASPLGEKLHFNNNNY